MILDANAMNVNENKQPIVMKNDILICWEKMSSTRELRKDQLTDFIPIMLLYVCPLKLHSKCVSIVTLNKSLKNLKLKLSH